MTTTERLHRLVDVLPDAERETAARVLEALAACAGVLHPVAWAHETARFDDEPSTGFDVDGGLSEARGEAAAGETVTQAEARRRLLGAPPV